MPARAASVVVVAVICGFVAAGAAVAETVPLPTPAPRPKTGAVTQPATQQAPASTNSAPSASSPVPANGTTSSASASDSQSLGSRLKGFFPFSVLDKDKDKDAPAGKAAAFDTKQRALLTKISAYLSDVQTLVGNFVQVGPDGRRVEGTFYIQKPGKVRFEYKPPSPIDIVADGSSVVVHDRSLETADYYPLSQTPLRYLLADHIDLLRDTDVVSVSADDTFDTVVLEETQLAVGTSRLMIMFDAKTLQLKQWTVTDPQGLDTTVAVYNLDTAKKPDPNLFVINYTANLK